MMVIQKRLICQGNNMIKQKTKTQASDYHYGVFSLFDIVLFVLYLEPRLLIIISVSSVFSTLYCLSFIESRLLIIIEFCMRVCLCCTGFVRLYMFSMASGFLPHR
jgi:hypothetical protein